MSDNKQQEEYWEAAKSAADSGFLVQILEGLNRAIDGYWNYGEKYMKQNKLEITAWQQHSARLIEKLTEQSNPANTEEQLKSLEKEAEEKYPLPNSYVGRRIAELQQAAYIAGAQRTEQKKEMPKPPNIPMLACQVIDLKQQLEWKEQELEKHRQSTVENCQLRKEVEGLKTENQRTEQLLKEKEQWIWDAAITLANNICVKISDRYSNDDQIEEANAANECAKRIRDEMGKIEIYLKGDYNPTWL